MTELTQKERKVLEIIGQSMEDIMGVTGEDFRRLRYGGMSMKDAETFRDGWYVFDRPKMYSPWATGENGEELANPKKNVEHIVQFAFQRFGHGQYGAEIRDYIRNRVRTKPEDREFDFVIFNVQNRKMVKWVSIEVASDDHFTGKHAVAKTISDAIKVNCRKANPFIIDARDQHMHLLVQQVRDAISSLL